MAVLGHGRAGKHGQNKEAVPSIVEPQISRRFSEASTNVNLHNVTKLADLHMELETLRMSEADLKKKLGLSEKEVARLNRELSEESENKQLVEEMDMAMNAMIEVRGTLMKEFRDEQTSKWDVEGDIKLMEELLSLSSPQAATVGQDDEDHDGLDAANLS
ncbi:hypothetical protein Dimus_005547 [Dionaea muscipula]